jgi:hypothetical protein
MAAFTLFVVSLIAPWPRFALAGEKADPLPLSYQQLEAKLKKVEQENTELKEDTLDEFTDSTAWPTHKPTAIDSWREMSAGLMDSGPDSLSPNVIAPKPERVGSCNCLVLQARNTECSGRYEDNGRAWGGRQSYSRADGKFVLYYVPESKNWMVSTRHSPATADTPCLVAQSSGSNMRPNGLPKDASWFHHASKLTKVSMWCDVCWAVPTFSPTTVALLALNFEPKLTRPPTPMQHPQAATGHFKETQGQLWAREHKVPTPRPTDIPTPAPSHTRKFKYQQGAAQGVTRDSYTMSNQEAAWQRHTPTIISEHIVTNMAALLGGSSTPTSSPTTGPTTFPTIDRWLLPTTAPTKYVYQWKEQQKRSGHDDDDDFHQAPEP